MPSIQRMFGPRVDELLKPVSSFDYSDRNEVQGKQATAAKDGFVRYFVMVRTGVALGELGADAAPDMRKRLAAIGPWSDGAIIKALSVIGCAEDLFLFLEMAESADEHYCKYAIAYLRFREEVEAQQVLDRLLEHSNERIREASVKAQPDGLPRQSRECVDRLLADAAGPVRFAVVSKLFGYVGDSRAKAIAEAMFEDSYWLVAIECRRYLMAEGEDPVGPGVAALDHPESMVANRAAYALAENLEQAVPALIAAVGRFQYVHGRFEAIRLLKKAKAREAMPVLVDLLSEDPSNKVRYHALSALTAFRTDAAVTALCWAVDDPDSKVSQRAISELGRRRPKEAIPVLCEHALNGGLFTRYEAIDALRRYRHSDATAALIDVVHRGLDDTLVEKAAEALVEREVTAALPAIVDTLWHRYSASDRGYEELDGVRVALEALDDKQNNGGAEKNDESLPEDLHGALAELKTGYCQRREQVRRHLAVFSEQELVSAVDIALKRWGSRSRWILLETLADLNVRTAVPLIQQYLGARDEWTASAAQKALERMGVPLEEIALERELRRITVDDQFLVAFLTVGRDAGEFVPLIRHYLSRRPAPPSPGRAGEVLAAAQAEPESIAEEIALGIYWRDVDGLANLADPATDIMAEMLPGVQHSEEAETIVRALESVGSAVGPDSWERAIAPRILGARERLAGAIARYHPSAEALAVRLTSTGNTDPALFGCRLLVQVGASDAVERLVKVYEVHEPTCARDSDKRDDPVSRRREFALTIARLQDPAMIGHVAQWLQELGREEGRQLVDALAEIGGASAQFALCNLLRTVHGASAASRLIEGGWKPANDGDRAYVAAYQQDASALRSLGAVGIRTFQDVHERNPRYPLSPELMALLREDGSERSLRILANHLDNRLCSTAVGVNNARDTLIKAGKAGIPYVIELGERIGHSVELARIFEKVRDERAEPLLLSWVQDVLDARKHAVVVRALGAIRSKRAVDEIAVHLYSREQALRRAAIQALERIGDPAALTTLEASRDTTPRNLVPVLDKAIETLSAKA